MEFNAWCLTYLQGVDTRHFAEAWEACEVCSLDPSGGEIPPTNVLGFLLDNVVLHGAVHDILLRPRPGMRLRTMRAHMPTRRDEAAVGEIKRLNASLAAIERSTSWQVTAPLRALGRAFKSTTGRRGMTPAEQRR